MKFKINKPKTVFTSLLFVTTSFAFATPNVPLEEVDVPWEWIFPEAEQQKTVEPCDSYPHCYDPPPFAPEREDGGDK